MASQNIKIICNQIRSLSYGKKVGGFIYAHLGSLDTNLVALIEEYIKPKVSREDLVIKVPIRPKSTLTTLYYPNFFTDPHPALCFSTTYTSDKESHREWRGSNRPILHRKELLIPSDHPSHLLFAELTRVEEELGLYQKPTEIGWSQKWKGLLEATGVTIEGHQVRKA